MVVVRRSTRRSLARAFGAGSKLGGGEGLHGQRVNLFAHSIAQGRVNPLVAAHTRQSLEFGRHDGGKKVATVAIDLQV